MTKWKACSPGFKGVTEAVIALAEGKVVGFKPSETMLADPKIVSKDGWDFNSYDHYYIKVEPFTRWLVLDENNIILSNCGHESIAKEMQERYKDSRVVKMVESDD